MKKEDLFAYKMRAHKRIRTCPPMHFFYEIGHSIKLQEHVEKCSSCRKIWNTFKDLGKIRRNMHPKKSQQKTTEIVQGQIWKLSNTLGGWTADALYCNAPFVLVLLVDNNFVTVAQTYGNNAMRCPGDIPFDNTSRLNGFVEPWNIYTVHSSSLMSCWHTVSMTIVFQTLMMIYHKFRDDLTEAQREFRKLEADVGHFISAQAQELLGSIIKCVGKI